VSRPFTPKVVTANDLLTGEPVYLTEDGRWSPRHGDAALLTDVDAAQDRLGAAGEQSDRVIGAYLADARAGATGPEPVHVREVIRTLGPSHDRLSTAAGAAPRP